MKSFNQPARTASSRANANTLQRVPSHSKPIVDNRPQAVKQRKLQQQINGRLSQIVGQAKKDISQEQWNEHIALHKRKADEAGYTLDEGKKYYDDSLARGKKLKTRVEQWVADTAGFWTTDRSREERKKWKAKASGSEPQNSSLGKTGTRAALNSKRYKTKVSSAKLATGDHEGMYCIETGRGTYYKSSTPKELYEDDAPIGDYNNYYNPDTKEFTAAWNMKDSDDKNNKDALGESVTNSEILWYQYKQVLSANNQNPKEAKSGNLESLIRSTIINAVTLDTILFSDINAAPNAEFIFYPTDELFWTLLGTPNGTAAAYLLLDHGLSMGVKNIESIKVKFGNEIDEVNMHIKFTKA